MLSVSSNRFVKFFPQVQWNHRFTPSTTPFARLATPAAPSGGHSFDTIADLRKRLDFRLWQSIASKNWTLWENIIDTYKAEKIPLDEVSFTLVVHGYLMSHHHPSSMAFLVLEEMKIQNVHPAIIQLNEELIGSFFQLSDIGIKSSLNGWQNIARLAWMSAARLRKKRARRVREYLKTLPTEEVLKIGFSDVKELMDGEHAMARLVSEDLDNDENLLIH